ncbi:MAG TPA: hypothetical protein VFR94_08025 [Nitrososphaeraceae archaeon]|nr:hypothetical protein [Nitrososphaeraceae archaeon]
MQCGQARVLHMSLQRNEFSSDTRWLTYYFLLAVVGGIEKRKRKRYRDRNDGMMV